MKTIEVYVVEKENIEKAPSILGYAKGSQKEIMEYFEDQQETIELENGPVELLSLKPVKIKYFSGGQAYWVQIGIFMIGIAVGKPEEITQYLRENQPEIKRIIEKELSGDYHLTPIRILNITPEAIEEKRKLIEKEQKLERKKAKLEQRLRKQKKKLDTLEEKLSDWEIE